MVIMFLLSCLGDFILSAVAAVGFAMTFSVPVKLLKHCALLGGIGHSFRFMMMKAGLSIEWSTLFAAMLIGVLGICFSRHYLAHPKVVTVAAIIPMVPGVYAYKAMISLVELSHLGYSSDLMDIFVTYSLRAAFITGALSIGLSIPGIWLYRRHPSV